MNEDVARGGRYRAVVVSMGVVVLAALREGIDDLAYFKSADK